MEEEQKIEQIVLTSNINRIEYILTEQNRTET